jgi:RNA polymerase sigma factor (sigma-70 family)
MAARVEEPGGTKSMAESVADLRLSRISTRWDLLVQAHQGSGAVVDEARSRLVRRYYRTVYRYLVGATGDPDVAEVLSQEFALRFLRGDFQGADPARGRFRDLVKTVLYHLIVDHHRQRRRQPASLPDSTSNLPAAEEAAAASDTAFLDGWRQELLDQAWEALASLEGQTGQRYYTVLRWRAEHPDEPAARLAERLGSEKGRPISDAGVRQILHRAREKFADLLLEEVARSLETTDLDRVEQELIDLGLHSYCRPALDRLAREGKDSGRQATKGPRS